MNKHCNIYPQKYTKRKKNDQIHDIVNFKYQERNQKMIAKEWKVRKNTLFQVEILANSVIAGGVLQPGFF